jgi:hypothetical protein
MPTEEKTVRDTDFHSWTIPLGAFAGQAVLISIATDAKGSNNADNHWWSRPKLVDDPKQKEIFIRFVDDTPMLEEETRIQYTKDR